jgi:hypothetical protein
MNNAMAGESHSAKASNADKPGQSPARELSPKEAEWPSCCKAPTFSPNAPASNRNPGLQSYFS